MCVHACIYACIYIYICIYTCVNMFTDPCVHRCKYMIVYTKAYKHIDIHSYSHKNTATCTSADRRTCVDDNIHGLDYICVHMQTQIHLHIHKHKQMHSA